MQKASTQSLLTSLVLYRSSARGDDYLPDYCTWRDEGERASGMQRELKSTDQR